MFDKLERIPEVINIELYIQWDARGEVGIEEIQQTQTSLQVTVPDAQYEYFTHVEHADVHADDDDDEDEDEDDDDYEDEDEDDDNDDDYVDDNIAINDEDFGDRDEIEDRIE